MVDRDCSLHLDSGWAKQGRTLILGKLYGSTSIMRLTVREGKAMSVKLGFSRTRLREVKQD